MIFDTHAHYDDEQFDTDRETLLASMPEQGVGTIVNVSATYESCERVVELVKRHSFMYAAVGIHPDEVGSLNEERFQQMEELSRRRLLQAVKSVLTIIGIMNRMMCRRSGLSVSLILPESWTFRC